MFNTTCATGELIALAPRDFKPTPLAQRKLPALIKLLDLTHGMEFEAVVAEITKRVSCPVHLSNILSR